MENELKRDELIRRSDVIRALGENAAKQTREAYDNYGRGRATGIVAARDLVRNLPAVDAVEMRHGRWVESDPEESFVFAGHTYYPPKHCSVCGRTALDEPWTYCPNCGSRMDGRREDAHNAVD